MRGSADYLERAVRNLVENAIDHTAADTTITMSVIAPGTITIRDQGPGIAPDVRPQIFNRFWQARKKRSGAGLGLDIVARTIAAHMGVIGVEDAEGGGALFKIMLQPAPP